MVIFALFNPIQTMGNYCSLMYQYLYPSNKRITYNTPPRIVTFLPHSLCDGRILNYNPHKIFIGVAKHSFNDTNTLLEKGCSKQDKNTYKPFGNQCIIIGNNDSPHYLTNWNETKSTLSYRFTNDVSLKFFKSSPDIDSILFEIQTPDTIIKGSVLQSIRKSYKPLDYATYELDKIANFFK